MQKALPEAEPRIREILCECDRVQAQLKEARGRLGVEIASNTRFRPREEIDDLHDLYAYWTDELADSLAAQKNPYSQKHLGLGGYILTESF